MEIPLKSDGRPDISKLLENIEKQLISSVKANVYEMPKFIPKRIEPESLESPQHSEWLKYLNYHWNDWSLPVAFESHRALFGRIIVKFKNLFQRFLRLTLDSYFKKELKYQENLVRHLNQTAKYIDDRDANIFWSLNDKIDSEVSAVNTRTDEIFDRLANEVLHLKEKVAELEKQKVV